MIKGLYGFDFVGPYWGTLEDFYGAVTKFNDNVCIWLKVKKKDKIRANFVCKDTSLIFKIMEVLKVFGRHTLLIKHDNITHSCDEGTPRKWYLKAQVLLLNKKSLMNFPPNTANSAGFAKQILTIYNNNSTLTKKGKISTFLAVNAKINFQIRLYLKHF